MSAAAIASITELEISREAFREMLKVERTPAEEAKLKISNLPASILEMIDNDDDKSPGS